jgi:hypothetical protein
MGNFFSMMVCGFFCVFWLSFGILQLPTAGIAASYSATGSASEGALSVGYNAGIALYLIALGCAVFTFFVFTLKINMVLALIFACATLSVFILSAAYWNVGLGNFATATRLQHVGFSHTLVFVDHSANLDLGWRSTGLHFGSIWLVCNIYHDGCRDGISYQVPSWRFVSFLAQARRGFGALGEERLKGSREPTRPVL